MRKIEGLILKSIDYKESSKIIYLFTPNGMESILVKGSKQMKSKFKGLIQNYTLVNCYTTDAKLPSLTDIDVVTDYNNIKTGLKKNEYAGLVIRIFNQTKYDSDKIYELLCKTMMYINDADERYYAYVFLLKNLYFLGITPNFSCLCGQNKKYIGFDINNGSMICEKCGNSFDTKMELIIKINEIFLAKLENKIEIDLDDFYHFLKKYYSYHASIEI